MSNSGENTPERSRKLKCCNDNCGVTYVLKGKLSQRHRIKCPGSRHPPTEESMDEVDGQGTCAECDQNVELVPNDDMHLPRIVDHCVGVGDFCKRSSNEPRRITCLVCGRQYVLRGDGKCRNHYISNDCTGSNQQPSPNYTTPGEGNQKFGACDVCKRPRKLKSSNEDSEPSSLVVENHSAPKIQCEGSGLTTEEMRIVREVKEKENNLDPADVDGLESNLRATSISSDDSDDQPLAPATPRSE